ncbi:MAG: hypothetical protein H8E62_04305 [Planctomycetes bacterium]|nr:hypothetical protein [Planctomycetota bacterium]
MNRKIRFLSTVFILFNIAVQADSVDPNNVDSDIMGEWVTVDFVKAIDLFAPVRASWKGELSLKGLSFEGNSVIWWFFGDNYRRKLTWEPGKVQTMFDRPALYQLKNIGGVDYLFFEWISGDVINRGMKPFYYVLKKGEIKSKYQAASPRGGSSQSNSGGFTTVKPVNTVDFYDDVRYKDLSSIQTLKSDLARSLRFNQDTVWPQQSFGGKTIEWFADKILHAAMNPGLGVRKLHKMGITGKGVNVAIIDQPMYRGHPEFKGKIAAYHDVGCDGEKSSMHGPAVASLLVGENCGTAPDAKLYYVAAPSWTGDAEYYSKALGWIIKQNNQLPAGQKIRVVSVSAAPSGPGSPFDKNNAMWDQACQKAEASGIMVLDCTRHHGIISGCFFEGRNVENPASCRPGLPSNPWVQKIPTEKLFVPRCPRTSAEEYDEGVCAYVYWGEGGLSWTIPYAAGVLAMGWQVWPEATPQQMKELLFQSAYVNKDGAKIINPPQFINAIKKVQKARTP